jgi:signal transduction histidine kinase
MSDKMLYNEIRAEQKFLTLINAAVSHELRNPLNSLVGQIESMNQYFRSFNTILKKTENDPIFSSL